MKFSERKSLKPISEIIQTDNINEDLRNSIWNILYLHIWNRKGFLYPPTQFGEPGIENFSTKLWLDYFKKPIDSRPKYSQEILKSIRNYYYSCEWYEVYDFLEFVLNYFDDKDANKAVNAILERELCGYRYIGGIISDITNEQEITMLEETLADQDFPSVNTHLQRALELLSDRDNPDYRNSIKESISAVESIARIITGKSKASLGEALKVIERSGNIHPALKESYSKLYGYTSDEGGIRHAMHDDPNLSVAEAKFFLLSCTSFINYLKTKI